MADILVAAAEHLKLSFIGVLIASIIGCSAGIILTRYRSIASTAMSITDIIQTIPSLAMLSILMMIFGLGDTTLVIALFLYSLLPIVRNTYVGILSVDEGLVEAGKGMGMTRLQLLFKVQIPIALPVILSGIRVALITAVGIAAIGVLVGAGGLGHYVWRGVQKGSTRMILSGAVPISLIAVSLDFLLLYAEKKMVRGKRLRKAS